MKLARLLFALLLAATTLHTQQPNQHVVGFMTDFDLKDDAIGICKAVMETIDPGIRIIAMSGGGRNNSENYLKIASYLGAHRILAKPFSLADLLRTISLAFGD